MPAPASVPGSETAMLSQKAEQMRAPVEANGRGGRGISLTFGYHPQPACRRLPGIPGDQGLGPGQSMGPKGSSEHRREGMEPDEGAVQIGWHYLSHTASIRRFPLDNGRILESVSKVCCEDRKQ